MTHLFASLRASLSQEPASLPDLPFHGRACCQRDKSGLVTRLVNWVGLRLLLCYSLLAFPATTRQSRIRVRVGCACKQQVAGRNRDPPLWSAVHGQRGRRSQPLKSSAPNTMFPGFALTIAIRPATTARHVQLGRRATKRLGEPSYRPCPRRAAARPKSVPEHVGRVLLELVTAATGQYGVLFRLDDAARTHQCLLPARAGHLHADSTICVPAAKHGRSRQLLCKLHAGAGAGIHHPLD